MTTQRHLVLGGSEGIGYSYAKFMAKKGDSLTIVARRQDRLKEAQSALLDAGAADVITIDGDLLDRTFRMRLWGELGQYDSILAGGPSPPEGGLEEILTGDTLHSVSNGYQAAIAYPIEVIQWALGKGLLSPGKLHLIGSHASLEPMLGSRFFLSASFRRIIDSVADEFAPEFEEQRKQLRIWRPRIVITPLSIEYVRRKAGVEYQENDVKAIFGELFNMPDLPTSDEYVREQLLGGGNEDGG